MTDAALAARDGRIGNVAGAVLLGGASRRMGRDKAALAVAGVPGATRTARLLDNLFDEVLLVGGAAPEDCPGQRVPDEPGPRCALRGLATALAAASAPRVFVVATDMPLLTPDLVLALVAWPEADAVVPRAGGRAHPLCAVYARDTVLPVARERLAGDDLALRGVLGAVSTAWLESGDVARVDPAGQALLNVNTPEDLAQVERLLSGA
ncbi:MAG: molybdenum cofactor guanylyltransferase [Myxococcota bacterium]|nr:molybdenum cofactor guanylyltransferase [Myxococcota bacterium]